MRHAALFGVFSLLAACTSAGGPALQPGTPVTLAPGQSATLPDRSTLRYLAVRSDSRCPPRVTCIHAGDAVLAFEHRTAAGTVTPVTLDTDRAGTVQVGGWRVTLVSLDFQAQPRVTVRIDRAGTGS